MSILANGYCTVCGEYNTGTVHVCPYSVAKPTAAQTTPSEASSNPVEQLLVALQEITRLLREIEYHVRTK